jgi:hypothetical protein
MARFPSSRRRRLWSRSSPTVPIVFCRAMPMSQCGLLGWFHAGPICHRFLAAGRSARPRVIGLVFSWFAEVLLRHALVNATMTRPILRGHSALDGTRSICNLCCSSKRYQDALQLRTRTYVVRRHFLAVLISNSGGLEIEIELLLQDSNLGKDGVHDTSSGLTPDHLPSA